MGDEKKLRSDLLDAVRGQEPGSDVWKKDQGFDAYFSGAGSQNIWLMRFATQALRGRKVPWEEVYHYQLGPPAGFSLIAQGGRVALTAEPADDDRVYTPGFGGSEFMSLIYWGWHLMSHMALLRAEGPIVERARRWVTLNWALLRALQGPDGSLLFFGQRSAGHNPIPREIDWFFALASDGDVRRAERWCKEAGAGLKQSWEFEIGNELKSELRATWQESLSIREEDLPGLIPLRVPTDIIRTTEGLAVVHAGNCNPNTPPILAGTIAQDGRREVLPTSEVKGERVPGGIRIRQKFDHATARIEGDEIVYASSLFTGGAEQRIPLPGGDVISRLRLGGGTAAPVPIDADPDAEPEDDDSEPDLPAPVRDLARAADIIAGLLLPQRQRPLQGEIIARLQGSLSDADIAALAAQVRTFGIGPGQPQAVPWREAIAILEG
jgi:hypothetical protein